MGGMKVCPFYNFLTCEARHMIKICKGLDTIQPLTAFLAPDTAPSPPLCGALQLPAPPGPGKAGPLLSP